MMRNSNWTASRSSIQLSDVETQHPQPGARAGNCEGHMQTAIQLLLHLSEEQIQRWPGVLAYQRHLEGCFQQLLEDEYVFAWTTIGMARPTVAADCWPWFNAVCSAARSQEHEDASIQDIWEAIRSSTHSHVSPTVAEETSCLIATFSVLCWGTMTLQPRLDWAALNVAPSLMVYHQQQTAQSSLRMDFVRRPVPAVFRHLQRKVMSTGCWRQAIGENSTLESTSLHVSSLNYSSLKMIGKIRLKWVNDLTSHLDFDFANRQLSIFKFPTFCALSSLEESSEPLVFGRLAHALYSIINVDQHTEHDDKTNNAQTHQEVLMSYRLLFGQTRESRRCARSALGKMKAESQDTLHDELLEALCCSRSSHRTIRDLPLSLWPISCRSFEGSLQEENAYSSRDDFPKFGQRLAKLQEFSLRQQPSKLRDLWRDRRNPLQWYTFWAVLIVGGSSLLLGILQLAVGAMQVVLAWPSATTPSYGSCTCILTPA